MMNKKMRLLHEIRRRTTEHRIEGSLHDMNNTELNVTQLFTTMATGYVMVVKSCVTLTIIIMIIIRKDVEAVMDALRCYCITLLLNTNNQLQQVVLKQIYGHNIGGSYVITRSADCVSHKSRALIEVINKQSIKVVLIASNLPLIKIYPLFCVPYMNILKCKLKKKLTNNCCMPIYGRVFIMIIPYKIKKQKHKTQ
jgi:hypothetical protein